MGASRHHVVVRVQNIRGIQFAALTVRGGLRRQARIIGKPDRIVIVSEAEMIFGPGPFGLRARRKPPVVVKTLAPVFILGFTQQFGAVAGDALSFNPLSNDRIPLSEHVMVL